MRKLILGFVLLFEVMRVTSAQAEGDRNTVQFLRDACKQEETAIPRHFCLGFIEGAAQAMTVNGYLHYPAITICPPDSRVPSGAALIDSFVNWADKHPEFWTHPAFSGLAHALQETWPCPKSN